MENALHDKGFKLCIMPYECIMTGTCIVTGVFQHTSAVIKVAFCLFLSKHQVKVYDIYYVDISLL